MKEANANEFATVPPIATSFSYTGRELDNESGFYYYRARYYDPGTGRFLQVDPHPGRVDLPVSVVNKYSYAGNNPINQTDPSGLSFWTDIRDFAIDAVVALAAFGAMVLGGATAAGAAAAVGATILGSMAIAGAQTLLFGGNYWENFHSAFRWSAGFLIAGSLGAIISGGKVTAGANTIFQGYVKSSAPILGIEGGLTIGASTTLSGVSLSDIAQSGLPFAIHELGHSVQYALLPTSKGFPKLYLGLGILGLTPLGTWWEHSADDLGRRFF